MIRLTVAGLSFALLLTTYLSAGQAPDWSVDITSPLGRTGVITKVRIVAQILGAPKDAPPFRAWFYVDGKLLGEVAAPPYTIDWVDDNPFERREIVVQVQDAAGRTASDTVSLPAFEITDQSDVTSVLLEAGVYDRDGRFVSHLDPSLFVVRENGVPQKADNVARQTVPTTIALLVDNSQSMSRRIEFVRLAAERLGDALRQHDKIIVVPFNKKLGTITGPTNDAKTIGEAVAAMRAQGGTAIMDSLLESTALFDGAEGRRAIILITDGYDEHSSGDLASALKAAQEHQIAVYVVGIGGVAGISLRGERLLRELTEKTGGRLYFPPRESQLRDISEAVSTDVYSRYLISYTPSDRKKDGTWREISVEVPEGYRVRTRAGYFAPRPPPIRPTLEFTVMNSSHEYLDVAAGDLEVVEDGVVQKVETFQEAVEPVSIVMAIDESGSMVKSAEAVRQAARDFVAAVRPEDSLALITFADNPVFAHMLGTDRRFTFDAIDNYKPAGGTALYDALYNSLMTLNKVPGRLAVVVLSDGRDENNPGTGPGSEHSFEDVLKLLRNVNASIFPIGLGARVQRDFLEKLAKESGGQAYFPADVAGLAEQYKGVVENLRRRYVLSYTSSNSKHDGSWRTVEIKSRLTGLQISTRGGYFAPAQ
ncbi:MAG TPA: VWA domain-containing protein [Vicinamibacterales bacterium]|nr:VWA domain-containing protein [Vicinamibacterales bacterium]